MKKEMVVLFAVLLMLPFLSADIIIDQQPQGVYNLGDIITIPTTFKSAQSVSGLFQMDLLCTGKQINFYKNSVSISGGEERKIEASLLLTKNVINESKGTCKVKAFIGNDFALSQEFKVSDLITITSTLEKTEFNPGEKIIIKGHAVRENNVAANGVVEVSITGINSSNVTRTGSINNGDFSVEIIIPEKTRASAYLMRLRAFEKDVNGIITNTGFTDQNILIKQVPKSLEIVFDSTEAVVEPGTNLKVKVVLHDQTGEKISSLSFLTVKNSNGKILEQREIATDEFLEYNIKSNELPKEWTVVAVSNRLTAESKFKILEKEAINIDIVGNTIKITNTGNIPYNNTAVVKIDEEIFNINVYLDIGKVREYSLTAPDGTYNVEVIAGSENAAAQSVVLTGNAIDIKEAGSAIGSLVKHPFIWVFVVLILGFVAFIVFKRGYQKAFVGYITRKKTHSTNTHQKEDEIKQKNHSHNYHEAEAIPLIKGSLVKSKNKAELSLSIKGEKQPVSIVAVHIKNIKDFQKKEGSTEETLQRIVDTAEQHKAVTYENQGTIFFIFAPAKTKTFKNEKSSLHTAAKIRDALMHHNKMFKQKIHFGIAINYGEIIAKHDAHEGIFKFMSLGTLISGAKKVSSIADEEVLLTEKANDRLRSEVKSLRHHKSGINVFSIKEIRDREDHSKFLKGFLHRLEKDKKK